MDFKVIRKKLKNKIDEINTVDIDNHPEILLKILEDAKNTAVIYNYLYNNESSLSNKEVQEKFTPPVDTPTIPKEKVQKPSPPSNSETTTLSDEIASKNPIQANSLAETLQAKPIVSISNALSLNERHLFANDLFDSNLEEFLAVLKKIDAANSLNDSLLIIKPFKHKYGWEKDNKFVQDFIKIIERRFL